MKKKNTKKTKKRSGKKGIVSKENRQLITVLAVIVAIFVLFLGTYYYIDSLQNFSYGGVAFQKINQGDLELFYGRFPIVYQSELVAFYNFYLRNNPKTNDIPFNAEISLSSKPLVSLDPEAGSCQTATMGQVELGKFLRAFPWVEEVKSGVTDQSTASELGVSYITCRSASEDQTVFIIQKSETPSIEYGSQVGCYVLNVGECRNIETVERFIVGTMAQVNGVEL